MTTAPQWITTPLSGVIDEHATTFAMVDHVSAGDLDDGEPSHHNPTPVPLRVSYLTSRYPTARSSRPDELSLLYVHFPGHGEGDDDLYVAFEHYNGQLSLHYITRTMDDTRKIVLIPDTRVLKED